MIYEVRFSLTVNEDLIKLAKSEPKAYQKALRFIEELREHPKTGTGHPELLKGKPEGRWSREITKKHRLVYRIFENEVVASTHSLVGNFFHRYKSSHQCYDKE